ncbi:sensor histidine kinase [Acidobacteria bacterium ACD]|nr:sensor histidine kinase [Acidobacteria bacterium ACD]
MRAEGAAELCPSEEGRKRLGDVTGLARRALDDLHRVIFDLRPSVLDDLGLFPAIRWFADRNLVPRGVSVRYDFEDLDALRLSPERETAVFRAVQEALTNVLRHSRASTVVVEAEIAARRLRIRVEDDGEGFDPGSFATPSESGRGLGLLGMRERLELLGGRAAIESEPGEGTAVVLEVPVNGPGGVDA